jgi:excisionase family DNA binding protein
LLSPGLSRRSARGIDPAITCQLMPPAAAASSSAEIMAENNEDVYLTTADALAYLRTARRTLYRFLASGKIPAVRIGHQWRFRKADLDRWVESRSRPLLPDQKTPPLADTGSRTRRVLVVDDEAPVRDLLERIFAVAGYKVEAVPDGLAALARLRAASFDLVVTDLKMPGMGGLELTREAKRLWPVIKVIVITGYPSQSSAIDAVNIGLDGYLTKPFHAIDLLLAAARALEPDSPLDRSVQDNALVQDSDPDTRS